MYGHIPDWIKNMKIKQSVINTMKRLDIPYEDLMKLEGKVTVNNRFGGGSCETTPLIAFCIEVVYAISNAYEMGSTQVNISDFDRLRYFVLEQDKEAYYTCLD